MGCISISLVPMQFPSFPRTFPSISPLHLLAPKHTLAPFVRFRFFSPTLDDLVTSPSPQNWMDSRDDNMKRRVAKRPDIPNILIKEKNNQKPCNPASRKLSTRMLDRPNLITGLNHETDPSNRVVSPVGHRQAAPSDRATVPPAACLLAERERMIARWL